MFYHEIYPGGTRRIVVMCEWLDNVEANTVDDHTSLLPQARRNRDSLINANDAFAFLDECADYNIMLCRHDPMDVYTVLHHIRHY
jgi:hypothetical protein